MLAVASLIGGVDMVDPTIKVINPVTSEESELPFVEVFKESELHLNTEFPADRPQTYLPLTSSNVR